MLEPSASSAVLLARGCLMGIAHGYSLIYRFKLNSTTDKNAVGIYRNTKSARAAIGEPAGLRETTQTIIKHYTYQTSIQS